MKGSKLFFVRVVGKLIIVAIIITLVGVIAMGLDVNAEGDILANSENAICIYTYEDLLLIEANPEGSYILMSDLDLKDYSWKPIEFHGVFNGNNHAILNLRVTETGDAMRSTYDGNYKVYDTYFAGLFSVIENATVKNLFLLGEEVNITEDRPCFIGSIAGYAWDSEIINCTIENRLSLYASSAQFGIGGITGFTNAYIKENTVETEMVIIDLTKDVRDEQFMGGVTGVGYPEIWNNTLKVSGYVSEHGYVHNGGLVGMYALSKEELSNEKTTGVKYLGHINNNNMTGFISFFEDNMGNSKARRAYCKDGCGEVMQWQYEYSKNVLWPFAVDERTDTTIDLYPNSCPDPTYAVDTFHEGCCGTENTLDEFPYSVYKCSDCDYTYRVYELKPHTFGEAEVITAPTCEERGLRKFVCANCGDAVYEYIPVLVPTPSPEPSLEPSVEPLTMPSPSPMMEGRLASLSEPTEEERTNRIMGIIFVSILVVAAICISVVILKKRR